MRSEKVMYQVILEVAGKLPQVKAIALSGSRVNLNAPKDDFQDYDIVYIVEDKEELLKERGWLDEFGARRIMQTPEEMTLFPPELGERFTFLMLFEDGNRIDLTLCPVAAIDEWLANEPMVKILEDSNHLLEDKVMPIQPETYQMSQASTATFQDCCNEFWWVSTYVVKGLCRKELTYASDHLYNNCQQELLRLLSWQIIFEKGPTDMGKNYKYLFSYNPQLTDEFNQLRDFTSLNNCWQSLLATQYLFHEQALDFSMKTGFYYDEKTAEALIRDTKRYRESANS